MSRFCHLGQEELVVLVLVAVPCLFVPPVVVAVVVFFMLLLCLFCSLPLAAMVRKRRAQMILRVEAIDMVDGVPCEREGIPGTSILDWGQIIMV